MMSSQKKLMITLLIAVVLMLVISAASFATESRIKGMGGFGNYLRDNSNIFTYPGTMYGYRGQAIAELRAPNADATYSLGAIVPLGENAVGLFLNRKPLRVRMPDDVDFGGDPVHIGFDNVTDFYFGMPMSSMDMGARLSIGGSGHTQDNYLGDDDLKASSRYIGLGAGMTSTDWDLGGFLNIAAAKVEVGDAEWTFAGVGFGVNARYFMVQGSDFEIIPTFTARLAGGSAEEDDGTTTNEITYATTDLGVGVGFNYLVGGGSTVIFVFEPLQLQAAVKEPDGGDKVTQTVITMPAFGAGFECQIKPWLTGRFGGYQTFQTITDKTEYEADIDNAEETYWATSFDMTFGLSFYFGCFTIDGVFNEGLLFDGPYFISGDNTSAGPMHSSISITYDFKK